MNKRQMSEQDIRSKFITPAIVGSGWDMLTQIREEVTFTQGRIIVRGKLVSRGRRHSPIKLRELKYECARQN
ncbi:MAG: hypothetical protein JRI91_08325 [Deltaproteobacteria bacterium]|nr:hypothetical protein [Deltaproteobacteria bacterium]